MDEQIYFQNMHMNDFKIKPNKTSDFFLLWLKYFLTLEEALKRLLSIGFDPSIWSGLSTRKEETLLKIFVEINVMLWFLNFWNNIGPDFRRPTVFLADMHWNLVVLIGGYVDNSANTCMIRPVVYLLSLYRPVWWMRWYVPFTGFFEMCMAAWSSPCNNIEASLALSSQSSNIFNH